MYCPNCGAENKRKQNYCRYCGLSLRDIERSYLSQLVFGEDTNQMKTYRNVRKFIDYTEILLIVSIIVAFLTLYFSGYLIKTRFLPIGIGIVFLFDIIRRIVRYFEQKSLRENNKRNFPEDKSNGEFETRETKKLIEEKEFVPASSITDNSTRRLYVERKAGESE
jgi:hypothetical protein